MNSASFSHSHTHTRTCTHTRTHQTLYHSSQPPNCFETPKVKKQKDSWLTYRSGLVTSNHMLARTDTPTQAAPLALSISHSLFLWCRIKITSHRWSPTSTSNSDVFFFFFLFIPWHTCAVTAAIKRVCSIQTHTGAWQYTQINLRGQDRISSTF